MSMSPEDDLLSSVLSAYRLRAGVYGSPRFCGAWQHGTAGMHRGAFHLIGTGGAWLHTRQQAEPVRLEPGDLVVLPHDAWHMLSAGPVLQGEESIPIQEGEGPYTVVVCGFFEFELGDKNPILDALPEVLVITHREGGRALAALGELMMAEADGSSVGTRTVLDRLADTLFVMVVRFYVNGLSEQRGVLAALADERLRRALAAMHRKPGADWSLESLAQEAGMSRSNFSQHFAAVVGATPIEYLTRWRMTQAELALRNPRVSVATVSEQMGYETEAAFRKAFKRIHGVGPGAIRRWLKGRMP